MTSENIPALQHLRWEHTEGDTVGTIVLNRPERLNALSVALMTEIVELCTWISRQHEIKVVIMRGEGRAFTAGFDLNDFTNVYGGSNPRAGAELGRAWQTPSPICVNSPSPQCTDTVSAVASC